MNVKMLATNLISIFCRRTYNSDSLCRIKFFGKTCLCSSRNTRSYQYSSYLNCGKVAVLKPSVNSTCSLPVLKSFNVTVSETKFFLKLHGNSLVNFRNFHTSERRYLHPIFWVILRPALKLLAVLTGRGFRKWWRDLPPNKKKYFIGVIKENKNKIAASALALVVLFALYYISHLEETPITKRWRFMAFNQKQLQKINEYEFKQIMGKMQSQILPMNHPYTLRVQAVVNRILLANLDIKEMKGKKWGVAVINSSVENAFVLPIGYVFVFTGMLNLCSNDDQLGIILSHEIAHCIQNHGAENLSLTHLLDLISIIFIAAIWAVLPSDSISLLTHWLYQKLTEILLQLPYNRKIETEADEVGLQLAARACFDVRESSAFWSKMAILNKTMGKEPQIEFLSTHPNHETRSEYLDTIMNKALDLRVQCGCPRLKTADPRREIEVVTKALDAARRKYLQQNPKPVYIYYN